MFIILSLIIVLITRSKLKKELTVKDATTLRTLNLVTVVIMIATTVFYVYATMISMLNTYSSFRFHMTSEQLMLILILNAAIALAMVIFTIAIAIWQMKVIKRLKAISDSVPKQAAQTEFQNASSAPEGDAAADSSAPAAAQPDNKRNLAFYISAATTPALFIIRMLSQTTEHISAGEGGSWKSHDVVVVPGNIQAIMFLLLIASICVTAYLRKESKSTDLSKSSITTLLSIANVILGLIITFAQF